MAELISPLAAAVLQRLPLHGACGVVVQETALPSLWQIAAWPGADAALDQALAALGLRPPGAGRSAQADGIELLWQGPARYWLLGEGLGARIDRLHARAGHGDLALLDLGHSRTCLRLAGPAALEIVRRGVFIDVEGDGFAPGAVVLSAIHGMGVTLHRRDAELVDLYVYRGFAVSMLAWLEATARPFGFSWQPLPLAR